MVRIEYFTARKSGNKISIPESFKNALWFKNTVQMHFGCSVYWIQILFKTNYKIQKYCLVWLLNEYHKLRFQFNNFISKLFPFYFQFDLFLFRFYSLVKPYFVIFPLFEYYRENGKFIHWITNKINYCHSDDLLYLFDKFFLGVVKGVTDF